MSENNSNFENRYEINDVGCIENRFYSELADMKRKKHSLVYHIVYALFVALVGFVGIDGTSIWFALMHLSVLAFLLYPALCVYSLVYSPTALKVLPTSLPLALYALRLVFLRGADDGFIKIAFTLIGFFMCIAISGIMFYTVVGRRTKLWCFTAVSLCLGAFVLAMGAVYAVYTLGELNVPALIEMLDGGIEKYSAALGHELKNAFEDEATLAKVTAAIPELSGKSAEKAAAFFSSNAKTYLYTVKGLLPGIFSLVCMALSFLLTCLFSLLASMQNLPLFVCVMDGDWSYRLPASCITVFDISLLLAVIANLFGLPQVFSLTVVNLLIILLPQVLLSTIKSVNFFMRGKFRSPAAAGLVTALIVFVALFFFGTWGTLLLCTVGVGLSEYRRKIELGMLISKIRYDEEAIKIIHESKSFEEADERIRKIDPFHYLYDAESGGKKDGETDGGENSENEEKEENDNDKENNDDNNEDNDDNENG